MFYQDGFPISMAVSMLKKEGITVSLLHVADECMKNGWNAKTTITKLIDDFQDDIDGNVVDIDELKRFCYAEYEEQREMIFKYLFCVPSNEFINDKVRVEQVSYWMVKRFLK